MKKKLTTIIGVMGISFVITNLVGCSNNQVNNVKNERSSKQTAQKSVTSSSKKKSNINNDEWMMMAYVAYRAKDGSENYAGTLNEVKRNLNDGNLSVVRNPDNLYTFSNDYGSVDVKVENDKVVVSNDETSTFSKNKLKDNFTDKIQTIKQLANNISKYSTSESNSHPSQKRVDGSQEVAKKNIRGLFNAMYLFNSKTSLAQRATKMLNYGTRDGVTAIAGTDAFDHTENQGEQSGTYYQPMEITKSGGLNQLYDVVVYSKIDSQGNHSVMAKLSYTVSVDKDGKVNGGDIVISDVESEH